MKTKIEKIIKKHCLLSDPMTIFMKNNGVVSEHHGFIVHNHIGLNALRDVFENEAKVYAFREDDDLSCEPATIENNEVVVNFFGYFVTPDNLDSLFNKKNLMGCEAENVWSWNYDPWN